MRPLARGNAILGISLLLAACGGGTATTAPTSAGAGATTTPLATTTPVATQAAALCGPSAAGATAVVSAAVEQFMWTPGSINAKVGDVIAWTNGDTAPHGVALDDSNVKCTDSIAGGTTGGTIFTVAGTYPFHCFVHSSMKGTFVIS